MKYLETVLLSREACTEIVLGNTAVVRAMIEAGTRVVTSYPGSPTPEIAAAIQSISQNKRPFHFEFSINEKVATEIAYGAALNGHLSTVFFKSVGLNVAADTFVQLAYMPLPGGMIIVLGDDPGLNSSQNEQDNRHYAHLSYIPVFEPASPTEVYHFYKEAARLSQDKQMPVIVRLTTHVCHAKEKVTFGSWTPTEFDQTPRFDVANGPYIPITSKVFPMKRQALKHLAEVQTYSEHSDLHFLEDNGNRQRGIVTMGLPYLSLLDVLENVQYPPDILKLSIVHPLPRQRILAFLKSHDEVKILEELDDVLEKEAKAFAYDAGLATRILGKLDVEDWVGEYTPDKVAEVLQRAWPDLLPTLSQPETNQPYVPDRPPQLCPGCGHRSAFYAIEKALRDADITVADIGCHTLGFLPPYEMGQALMCMGASTGIGSGLSLFQRSRKVVAFLGDSTFFHAGLPGIINALFNNHHITLILLENGTTAMTGHQNHPGSGRNFNEITEKIPVRQVLEGLGVRRIYEVDAYQQVKLTDMVKQAVADNAFSVVIAKHPCMLKFTREQRKKSSYTPRQVTIDQEICEQIHECVAHFACPTFTRLPDGRIEVNHDLCIGDGSCVQTCPVGAITSPKKV